MYKRQSLQLTEALHRSIFAVLSVKDGEHRVDGNFFHLFALKYQQVSFSPAGSECGGRAAFVCLPGTVCDAVDASRKDVYKRQVIRTKEVALRPMTEDEAILQMNMLGHNFFVFLNGVSGDINVVYRRKTDGYGLIIPEK